MRHGMHPEQKNGTLCPSRNGTTKSFGQSEFDVYSITMYLKDKHKLKKRERLLEFRSYLLQVCVR